MAPNRRMGPKNSATRDLMFDAAERILRTEGYSALTARRLAEEAKFNHQTVYYYFETMDDLIVGAFKRRTEHSAERLKAALASDRPLHALWQMHNDGRDTKLS